MAAGRSDPLPPDQLLPNTTPRCSVYIALKPAWKGRGYYHALPH